MRFCGVLVAACLERLDRCEPVGGGRLIAVHDDSGDGELQRLGDARIAFLGELRLERGERLRVAGSEHVSGCGETLLGVGVCEGQRAHRAFDGAAQRVVDAHFLERGRHRRSFRRSWRRRPFRRPCDRRRRGCPDRTAAGSRSTHRGSRAPCGGASAASSAIAFSLSANLSVVKRASVSSRASARAAPEKARPPRSARTVSAKTVSASASAVWRTAKSNRTSCCVGSKIPSARASARRGRGACALGDQPPHLPVLTLKLPQDMGGRQSAIRSRDPSR